MSAEWNADTYKAALQRREDVRAAERAVVEAAEAWRDAMATGTQAPFALVNAVDALRRLRHPEAALVDPAIPEEN